MGALYYKLVAFIPSTKDVWDFCLGGLKKLVQKIVLISGDSDFVPAAKLARVEGIIFTLDPMGNPIREDLQEHIDYLTTRLPQFKKQQQ